MELLYSKVYGALIGGAIGDAMGGPVEMMSWEEIRRQYGHVSELMQYKENQLGPHGCFTTAPGSYTDDSRMVKVICEAMDKDNGHIGRAELSMALQRAYILAESERDKAFYEEYYYKSVYGERKAVFGGQTTNGAIMCMAPFGIINACRPRQAHDECFDSLFFTEGYARYSASIAAAALAAAFTQESDVETCIHAAIEAAKRHKGRREGSYWTRWSCYEEVAAKNERLLNSAIEASARKADDISLYKWLDENIAQPFFADGSETLALALTFSLRAGSFSQAIELCVNYGRDCDSSAAVAGALCGALYGAEGIPEHWIEQVEKANPAPGFKDLAKCLCRLIGQDLQLIKQTDGDLSRLFKF